MPLTRSSSDADVWIRPEQVERFVEAVRRAGWRAKTSFSSGSAFGHAMNVHHPWLGNADLHRHFPGMDESGFEVLWRERLTLELGHVTCAAPSVTGQRLVLLLHAARSGPDHPDRRRAWDEASPTDRQAVLALADDGGAQVALAAALGQLDRHRDRAEHQLWEHFATGNPHRLDEWRARWAAATTPRAKLEVARQFVLMDRAVLESELGRPATTRERLSRQRQRWARLLAEIRAQVTKTRVTRRQSR